MACGGFNEFKRPITLDDLNRQISTVTKVYEDLTKRVPGSLYFPFIFYREAELRAQQGYLAKFPAALVAAIPELQGAVPASADVKGTVTASKVRRAVGMPRTKDPEQARAVERWAVERAKQHYHSAGATKIIELGKPYDLVVHGLGPERHVEVKGSSVQVSAVELTVNEVAHARNFSPTDLIVVDQIECRRKPGGGYATSGGVMRVYASWSPADEDLSTTKFRYDLPQ
ncbi:DUF3883 domain-containing protein [Dactylosporangium sp. NPDC049525]|uniref:protein NO VEIN domain-containing protein n=1 Tax=Dactylosporangium sp. NPDC049525 TaxID=3154730 RepID=UPI0034402399